MVPPPTLGSKVSLTAIALLDLLEKATGWVYCCFCYHMGSQCTCMGTFPLSWSQVVGESLGHGATASSGDLTTPGMPAMRYLPPPPGLPPIDYNKWRLPPPEASATGVAMDPLHFPGVGRSAGLWGTVERIIGSPCPGGLAQRMPAPPMTMPCMPQTMPVWQPCPEQPATPYQQVVQPPKRPTGWGAVADIPTNKTTPMGGTMQDHGRPAVRGWEHGSHSVSHPRGAPETVSAQQQHQEGGLPSGLTPSGRSLPPPPPPPATERTQPQQRGRKRSALWDPARLVANYRSSGWRKDLEHILKVYYKFSVDYFTEEDWSQVKDQFFDLFLQHKKEALEVKEACPLDFMAYIQDLFYQATGLHLDGLGSFTRWIKKGSYYHGVVAHQGHLWECPHLEGAPLPRQPQLAPSESPQESQMRAETQVPSSRRPSAEATVAPVVETAVVETPIVGAPVAEAPVVEPAIMEEMLAEAPTATPSLTAPMVTGGLVVAHHGPNRWRKSKKSHSSTAGQPSAPTPCLGGRSQHRGSHSPSRTMRGDSPPSRGCMNMPPHNLPPLTTRWAGDQALAPQTAATSGHKPGEPSGLHDRRVSFNREHLSV